MKSNLEKLILQQKPMIDSFEKSTVGILYLSAAIINAQQLYLKQFGITCQQYNVLRILRGQGKKPASILLIKERMLDKMSDVSRLVDRLKTQALVEKIPNIKDKRKADVILTSKANEILAIIDKEKDNLIAFSKMLTLKENNTLNEFIDKMLEPLLNRKPKTSRKLVIQ